VCEGLPTLSSTRTGKWGISHAWSPCSDCRRDGFFVENHTHAPKLEQQIAELASGDLTALAAEFARRGHQIDLHEMAGMYVHVDLDADLRRRVHERAAAR